MEIKDLAGLSDPLGKVVDAIRAAVGTWYEPRRIRREAQARADALQIYTAAEVERSDTLRHAAQRIASIEIRRQENIEAIADRSLEELPRAVSDVPVDPDWVALLFDECKDVSTSELQTLWARLLAGEVAQPGSFSRRAMAALKLMSSTDAKVFTLLCGALFQSRSGRSHLLLDDMADAWLQTQGLSSDDRFYLQSIGLIHGELVLNLSKSGTVALVHFGKPYKHSLAAIHKSPDFLPVLTETLTPVGSELLNVVNATPNQAYLEVLARGLLDQGFILVQDNA